MIYPNVLINIHVFQSSIFIAVIATGLMPIKSPFDCVGELWLMLREIGKIDESESRTESRMKVYSRRIVGSNDTGYNGI